MDGEVEIATDVGVFTSDDFEVVFGGEIADMGVWGGGGDDDLARIILVYDGFDARFEVRAFFVGQNDESVEGCSWCGHLDLLGLSTSVEFVLEKSGVDSDEDETRDEEGIDGAIDRDCGDED